MAGNYDEQDRLPPRCSPTSEIWHRLESPSWFQSAALGKPAPMKRPGARLAAGQGTFNVHRPFRSRQRTGPGRSRQGLISATWLDSVTANDETRQPVDR